MTYDPKCYNLARVFIEDLKTTSADEAVKLADDLAKAIQSAIEDWMGDHSELMR